jgi:hypothetical protein
VKPKVFKVIRPFKDGRRHGRGTYLLLHKKELKSFLHSLTIREKVTSGNKKKNNKKKKKIIGIP